MPAYRSWTGAAADSLRAVVGFACFGALALSAVAVCWTAALLTKGERRKRVCQEVMYRGLRLWEVIMERIGVFHVDFPEVEALRGLRGMIIAPSHPSLIDAPHFLARMPRLTCLMKKSVLRNPFLGSSARLAGYLPNDHGREFIRLGRDALRAGDNLLIFPEGTRTVQSPVNPFKLGFALMATLADAPVQTVFIDMPVLRILGKQLEAVENARVPGADHGAVGAGFSTKAGAKRTELG